MTLRRQSRACGRGPGRIRTYDPEEIRSMETRQNTVRRFRHEVIEPIWRVW